MPYATSSKVGADLNNTSTTQLFALGEKVQGSGASEWVYVVANNTISAYKMVAMSNAFSCGGARGMDLLSGLQLGVAQTTFASGEYGWVAIRGNSLGVLGSGSSTTTAQGIYLHGTGLVDNQASGSGTLAGISIVSVAQTAGVTVTGMLLSYPRGKGAGL